MHHYERITAVETTQIADMGELVKKCRGQLDECDEASQSLQGFLSELQLQRDNARGLIEETYQTYRAKLEKIKVRPVAVECFRIGK
jgi:tripartite motif-containing protein 2/3